MTTSTLIAPSKPALQRPSLYKIIFLDDDVSTFQCVIDILVNYFDKSEDDAYECAMDIHITGSKNVGVYPKDIAETKISLAKAALTVKAYPLRIELMKSA